jgi:hypothetical protein
MLQIEHLFASSDYRRKTELQIINLKKRYKIAKESQNWVNKILK